MDRETVDVRAGLRLAHPLQHSLRRQPHLLRTGQVERDSADLGLVRNVRRQDLQRHRIAHLRGRGDCCDRRRSSRTRGDGLYPVGRQQGFGLGFGHQCATARQCGVDQRLRASPVRRQACGGSRWSLHQLLLVTPVGQAHRKGANRLLGCLKAGDPCVLKSLARLRDRCPAKPASKQARRRLRSKGQQGARYVGAGDDRRRRMDEQHGPCRRILVDRFQCLDIALGRGVADDVDRIRVRPVGWQYRIELRDGRHRQLSQRNPCVRSRVGGHDARAAAVGQHRQLVGPVRTESRQRLRSQEQIVQRVDAQHARARNRRLVDHIRACHGAGVRCRCALALERAAGLDHDDRLVARSRACRRHELARRIDRFDVEQDGPGVGVTRQIVQYIAKVDVGVFAERHQM